MLRRNLGFLIIILSFVGMNINNVVGATTADWGDIVNVRYSLYLDAQHTEDVEGNINQFLGYLYLNQSESVPLELLEQYPQASSLYLDRFKEEIVGTKINIPKEFVILAKDGYDQINHELFGKDLYYIVTLLEIVYDASPETSLTTTTTTQNNPLNLLEEFGALIAIGGGLIFVGGIYTLWSIRSTQRRKLIAQERLSSTVREQTIKKERSQLKELRELTESFSSSEDTPQKSEVKFRRRR
ncbi:MAG: hypothetical protein ACFE9L_20005 [Candidatus Hodarchaeota archaeon]